MRIGIDISQSIYKGTGVARYVRELTFALLTKDRGNDYVLLAVTKSHKGKIREFFAECKKIHPDVQLVLLPFPIRLMEFVWNRLGIIPVEWFTGRLDIFWSSDWVQPPLSGARGVTTIHDLTICRYPESFDKTIVSVQKRKLERSKRICAHFLCDSQASKNDAIRYLALPDERISVVYPGFRGSSV